MAMLNLIPKELMVWALPLGVIVLGVILGWLFKQFIHAQLIKMTEKTDWHLR